MHAAPSPNDSSSYFESEPGRRAPASRSWGPVSSWTGTVPPGYVASLPTAEGSINDQDEQALMARYASGDDRAFDALFDAFAPRLMVFLRRGFGDASVAEDLLQLTFQRVHASRASYRPDSPVRPWLFTIAARVRIDELRRRYRVPPMADEEALDHLVAAEPIEAARDMEDRARAVRDAVDSLPESQRVVVHLHRFEGLTFSQIANVLGVKEGAVRVRAFRAYETLRERLRPLVQAEAGP